uniref:Serpentine receptor class gamma n=1 Tax=Caenorhabditis tropicalis TaxID=1561998 RepID=A0A1I7TUX3_9PELO
MADSSEKCASEELLISLTSSLMMTNHCFIILVIFVSLFATVFALRKLWKQNIFSNGTRILLLSAIVNGVIHQLTVAEIRVSNYGFLFDTYLIIILENSISMEFCLSAA